MDMHLQFHAFPVGIRNDPADNLAKSGGYGSGSGRRSILRGWMTEEVQVTSGWRESHDDGENTEGLVSEEVPDEWDQADDFFRGD